MKKILFLSNNPNIKEFATVLSRDDDVIQSSDVLTLEQVKRARPDLIISYNYRYIIGQDVIDIMNGSIINFHISLLPWNRGANPNFWSFIDDTPKGVTIHQISAGLDKGNIMYQKECFFDTKKETFASAYDTLNKTMIELFLNNRDDIKHGRAPLYEQSGNGSYHSVEDFKAVKQKMKFSWDESIDSVVERYNRIFRS